MTWVGIDGIFAFVSAFLMIGNGNAFSPLKSIQQSNIHHWTRVLKQSQITLQISEQRGIMRTRLMMSQKEEGDYFYGVPFAGHKSLVEERDACGVGFIANAQLERNHKVVNQALKALGCMEHRGACSADKISGDGSGIMTAIPHELFEEYTQGIAPERVGVGMVFLSKEKSKAAAAISDIEETITKYTGLKLLGWREVPVNEAALGEKSAEFAPWVVQFFVALQDDVDMPQDEFERLLYLVRRTAVYTINRDERILDKIRSSPDQATPFKFGTEQEFPDKETVGDAAMQANTYICSLSSRRIVYKGMVRGEDLSRFYLDLQDERYISPFALYHRRFSTNTMPKWPLAQPMRVLGHNGEINTVLGNINWMRSREACQSYGCGVEELYKQEGERLEKKFDLENFLTECGSSDFDGLESLVDPNNSDSANLDSAFELLIRSGKNAYEALMILVPEAYKNQPELRQNPEVADFYRYHEHLQEPWDGPALLVFCDGKRVGACLDRNGLRPARYYITKDGMVCMHSETGVVPVDESQIVQKGRLGPGQMIAVDLLEGNFMDNWTIKKQIASRFPYGEWLKNQRVVVEPKSFSSERSLTDEQLLKTQTAYGWGVEDVDVQIQDMALTGKEATYSMGDDIPLAFLSEKPHVLYDYFKQRFAQVTNPPIDPLREGTVMSVEMNLGPRGNVRRPSESAARALTVSSPVLNEEELDNIYSSGFKTVTLPTLYDLSEGPEGLEKAVDAMTRKAIDAVLNDGAEVIVLSDKQEGGISSDKLYIPPLLATGAVHHRLIEMGLRMRASIVVESAQIWGTHHFACLVGYGASAAHPYLALETTKSWLETPRVQMQMSKGNLPQIDAEKAQANYRASINGGLLKIMSKMGISCLNSYQGAQIFEGIGIGEDLLKVGFKGTPSRVSGLSISDLAQETATFHQQAFEGDLKKLYNYGYVKFFRGGEYHHNSVHKELHAAVRQDKFDLYNLYMDQIETRPVTSLRDMLEFDLEGREPIPLDQVQPAEEIMKRFCTGGMSLGALSREAHETLAIALNRIGGKSNSGEGGEDPERFRPLMDVTPEGQSASFPHLQGLKKGDLASSKIKQVASGRFGVTPEYIMSAEQLEIKIAQGAKPGEGGQLPGPKIDEYIAGLRASTPGVTLISPPPHHDIYSIEDLAQLIHDLHQINPDAGVSVKLVSEIGIGTVAAGVAKADADIIQISGHDGGTGASPLSSIKHAGSPWELGLTEVHRTLMQNGLRDRVLLRVDGGLKSGWDVMMAALMGGEEFGFGTIAMVAEGCIMARVCHTNSCPVGITTQKEELRKRFPGTPDHVVTFFQFVAEETRHILAKLGYRNLEDVIGRADLLKQSNKALTKTDNIDLRVLTKLPDASDRSFLKHGPVKSVGHVLDDDLVSNPEIMAAVEGNTECTVDFDIVNTDRSVGGRLAGLVAKKYGNKGFRGQINLNFQGSAGQSFANFGIPGINIHLTGEANDYVGKGLHGGEIVIVPPAGGQYDASEQVIIGNTCLYGATGGKLFALGKAGERLAVRNSGATVVVEGAGDHCLEYMTGGVVVVLGKTGRNIGAGMTGGLAYILDEQGDDKIFDSYMNTDTVKYQHIQTQAGEAQLKKIIQEYAQKTGSSKAQKILDEWDNYKGKFRQIYPPSQANKPEVAPIQEKSSVTV